MILIKVSKDLPTFLLSGIYRSFKQGRFS